MAATPRRRASSKARRRTYVLDTSVLLADPSALTRFAEHEVVVPIVVVTELEAKRHHPELGYFARNALRLLDEMRVVHGRLDAPIPVGDLGGTLRVELNHTDPRVCRRASGSGDNDSRILAVACNLRAEGLDVTLVSKDLPMRVKASAVGLPAEEYRAEIAVGGRLRLDRDGRARGRRGLAWTSCSPREPSTSPRPPTCPATPGWCCSPSAARPWAA